MFLFPTIPLMLIGTIVVTQVLQKRGLLGTPDRTVPMEATLATVAGALSLGAAGIHFAVIQQHLAYDIGFGAFFIGLAWFQAIWAQLYLLRRTVVLAGVAVAVNTLVVLIWAMSRTTGLPFGPLPWVPEPIGTLDVFATVFEVALVGTLLPKLVPSRWPTFATERMPFERAFVLAAFSVLTITLLASLALLGTTGVEAAALP
jgi:hypothetical protein